MKNIVIAICLLFMVSCGGSAIDSLPSQDDTTSVLETTTDTTLVEADSTLVDTVSPM